MGPRWTWKGSDDRQGCLSLHGGVGCLCCGAGVPPARLPRLFRDLDAILGAGTRAPQGRVGGRQAGCLSLQERLGLCGACSHAVRWILRSDLPSWSSAVLGAADPVGFRCRAQDRSVGRASGPGGDLPSWSSAVLGAADPVGFRCRAGARRTQGAARIRAREMEGEIANICSYKG